MTWVLVNEYGDQPLDSASGSSTIEEVSDSIFSPYLLPFWALSFLLLAAVIGAIVLARKD
jgi:NADH-quinone oxidoreductase subunit J